MVKTILHIDLNAFFVRCEELKNPSLEGKVVIVGSTGRCGIVSTCSYAARKKGIHSGMPTFKALQIDPHAIVVWSSYSYYSEKSKEFFNLVKKYTQKIEMMSIDECFADMTEELKNVKEPIKYLKDMQMKLYKETGLPCSIGVAPTRFLAKMASDMKKPLGLTVIRRKDVRKMLDPLPIGDFFGIGKKTAPRLEAKGIKTIGDLAKLVNENEVEAEEILGKFYYTIKDWINGYGSDEINMEPWDPKSIGHSMTFMHDSNSLDEIRDFVKEIAKEVSERAKAHNKIGGSVQLVLKDTEFKTINRSKKLSRRTNDFAPIFDAAVDLLEANFEGQYIRLAGVTLQNLINPNDDVVQMSIFDNFDEIKEECATKLLIGELNRRTNKSTFVTASDYLKEKKNVNK